VDAGDHVEFVELASGEFALKAATEDVRSLKGMIRPASRISIEAMNADRASRRQSVIGLGANVLVRYIAQDDRRQAPKAARVIEAECSETRPGFVAAPRRYRRFAFYTWPLATGRFGSAHHSLHEPG
jgi:hypothetical protein